MRFLKIFAIMCALLVTSCEQGYGEKVQKEFDRTTEKVELVVVVYPNEDAVDKAYRNFLGDQLKYAPHPTAKRASWARWNKKEDGKLICEVHTVDIRGLNDKDRMISWGHELAHCMYGNYHN